MEGVDEHFLARRVAAAFSAPLLLLSRTVFKWSSQIFTSNVGNNVALAAC